MQRDCCNRPKSKWCRINQILWKRHWIVWSLKIWQSRHLCNQLKQHIAWPSRRQCSISDDHISHNTLINSTPLTLKPVATIPPHLAGVCVLLHHTDLFQTYVPNLSTIIGGNIDEDTSIKPFPLADSSTKNASEFDRKMYLTSLAIDLGAIMSKSFPAGGVRHCL